MSKLRPVEEVAEAIQWELGANLNDITKIEPYITQDRHSIHTLLREMTTRKSVKELFPDADVMNSDERLSAQVAYKNAYNQALDDILTLIDELFSDKK